MLKEGGDNDGGKKGLTWSGAEVSFVPIFIFLFVILIQLLFIYLQLIYLQVSFVPNINILIRDFIQIFILMDIFIGQLGPQLFLHRLCRLSGGISKTTNYFLVSDYWMIFHPQVTGWKSRQIQTSNFQRIFLIARSQGADWPSLLVASASLAGPWQG